MEKLESLMSLYMVGTPDFIIIYLKEILVDDNIKIGQLTKINLPNRLINVGVSKTILNSKILPLTLEEKQFGSLLQADIKSDYLKNIIEKLENNLLFLKRSSNTHDLWEKDNKLLLDSMNVDLNLNSISIVTALKDEIYQIAFLKQVFNKIKIKLFLIIFIIKINYL